MAARRAAVLSRGAAEWSRCQPSARKPRRIARPARLPAGIVTRLGVQCYFSPVVAALSLDGRELITATTLAKGNCAASVPARITPVPLDSKRHRHLDSSGAKIRCRWRIWPPRRACKRAAWSRASCALVMCPDGSPERSCSIRSCSIRKCRRPAAPPTDDLPSRLANRSRPDDRPGSVALVISAAHGRSSGIVGITDFDTYFSAGAGRLSGAGARCQARAGTPCPYSRRGLGLSHTRARLARAARLAPGRAERYRLATYWLPVAPSWLSWRALPRREYV